MSKNNDQDKRKAALVLIRDLETKISTLQALLTEIKDQYNPLPTPDVVSKTSSQQDLFPSDVDYDVPLRGNTLSHHIYWALESQKKGEFTTRSLAHFLTKANRYKKQSFEQFRSQIQNAVKHMRRNTKRWPDLGWRETRRPQGGTIYMYRWQE